MKSVILAGGRLNEDWSRQTGLTWRAELPFKGEPFLDIVIRSMPAQVIVVGGPPRHDLEWHEGGDKFIDSFAKGIEVGGAERFLMASADLPFLTSECVQGFLAQDDKISAIQYPIVSMELMKQAFGAMPRTSLKLREGEFTGGNLFLVDGKAMQDILPLMQRAYDARKNVLQLGQILGFATLLTLVQAKLLPGSVKLSKLEQRVGSALKTNVRAVVSDCPGLAADIDTPEQFSLLKAL